MDGYLARFGKCRKGRRRSKLELAGARCLVTMGTRPLLSSAASSRNMTGAALPHQPEAPAILVRSHGGSTLHPGLEAIRIDLEMDAFPYLFLVATCSCLASGPVLGSSAACSLALGSSASSRATSLWRQHAREIPKLAARTHSRMVSQDSMCAGYARSQRVTMEQHQPVQGYRGHTPYQDKPLSRSQPRSVSYASCSQGHADNPILPPQSFHHTRSAPPYLVHILPEPAAT